MITNALLRIDGVKGSAPAPFEKPSSRFNFWVLEMAIEPTKRKEKVQMEIINSVLKKVMKPLRSKVPKKAEVTLFIEFDRKQLWPHKIDSRLISTVADFGGSIEIYTPKS